MDEIRWFCPHNSLMNQFMVFPNMHPVARFLAVIAAIAILALVLSFAFVIFIGLTVIGAVTALVLWIRAKITGTPMVRPRPTNPFVVIRRTRTRYQSKASSEDQGRVLDADYEDVSHRD